MFLSSNPTVLELIDAINAINKKLDATIEIDEVLSETSENPVQNKVIKAELDAIRRSITSTPENYVKPEIRFMRMDTTPTLPDVYPYIEVTGTASTWCVDRIKFDITNPEFVNGALTFYRDEEVIKEGIDPNNTDFIDINLSEEVTKFTHHEYILKGTSVTGEEIRYDVGIFIMPMSFVFYSPKDNCENLVLSGGGIRPMSLGSWGLADIVGGGYQYVWFITTENITQVEMGANRNTDGIILREASVMPILKMGTFSHNGITYNAYRSEKEIITDAAGLFVTTSEYTTGQYGY